MLNSINAERFVIKVLTKEELMAKFHASNQQIWELFDDEYSIAYVRDYGRMPNTFCHFSGYWLESKVEELLEEYTEKTEKELVWDIVDKSQIDENILYVAFKTKAVTSW